MTASHENTASRKTVTGRARGYLAGYNPQAKTLRLLEDVKGVLDEYRAYWPLTCRQIYYRLVGARGYPKTEQFYGTLCHHLGNARRAKVIPFAAIRDDGVSTYSLDHFDDEEHFLRHVRTLGQNYKRNKLAGQDFHIEVWCEAAGMLPQLFDVAEPYSIPVYSSGGFDSLTAKKRLADRICDIGKRAVILHLGDFDPSGQSIFDSVAADVAAFVLADRPAEQMAKVRDDILTLAEGGEVASSIEEISSAFERGAAAGLPLDGLRDFALLSTKAADAFEMSAEQVGNAFAGFEKVLGVPRAELEKVADLINHLADSGIADESDIVTFMDSVGAMAKTVGLSVEETAAFGAALANLKVPAGEAATAMNSILTKLVAPDALSKKAAGAMQSLVGDVGAFASALSEDADTAIVGLLERLKELDAAERAGAIANIFGLEHTDVVSQMVEGIDEMKRNLHEAGMESLWLGSLQRSYNLKLDDTSSKMKIFWSGMKGWLITIGDRALPILNRALDKVRDFMTRVRSDGVLGKVADGFEGVWLAAEHLAIQVWRIGSAAYYTADAIVSLTSKITGLSKAWSAAGLGVGLLATRAGGRAMMMALARRIPQLAAALAIDDIISGLNGDNSIIGGLKGGQDALDAVKRNFEDLKGAAEGLAETLNGVFGFDKMEGQTQLDALMAGIKDFAKGEYVKAVNDLALAIQAVADNLRAISDALQNPEAAFERFADAAIAQMDRVLAYIDNRFGGALTSLGLLSTNNGEIVGPDGTVFKDGGAGEKQSRKPVTWRTSQLGQAILGEEEDAATSRVSGAFGLTRGTGQPSARPSNMLELEGSIFSTIRMLPTIIGEAISRANGNTSQSNVDAFQRFIQGMQNAQARMDPANVNMSAVDSRSFPVTNNVSAPVTVNVQQASQAPAAAGAAVGRAVGQAAVQTRAQVAASAAGP